MTAVGRSKLFPAADPLFTPRPDAPPTLQDAITALQTVKRRLGVAHTFPALTATFLKLLGSPAPVFLRSLRFVRHFYPRRYQTLRVRIHGHIRLCQGIHAILSIYRPSPLPINPDHGYSASKMTRILAGLAKDRSKGFSLLSWMPGAARAYGRGYPINAAVVRPACLLSWIAPCILML